MGQLENVQSGESIHLLISVFFGPHLRLTSKGFCHRFSPKWYNTCMCDDSLFERVMTHASSSKISKGGQKHVRRHFEGARVQWAVFNLEGLQFPRGRHKVFKGGGGGGQMPPNPPPPK